jgi:hypothetical protein
MTPLRADTAQATSELAFNEIQLHGSLLTLSRLLFNDPLAFLSLIIRRINLTLIVPDYFLLRRPYPPIYHNMRQF